MAGTDPLRVADWRLQIGWSGGITGKLHFSTSAAFFGSSDVFASQWTEYFSGIYDDVTDDVAEGSQVTWSRGSDAQVDAQVQAGESSCHLLNALTPYLYDPNDPRSPLANGTVSPGFQPMRPIRLIYSLDGGTTWLGAFYHFIVEADYDPSTYTCSITAQDLFKWMDRYKPVIPAASGITSSQAIGLILDAIGFKDPACRNLEAVPAVTGITFSADGSQTASSLMQSVMEAEQGLCWVDGNGVFQFDGRYARDLKRSATRSFTVSLVGISSKVSVDLIGNVATVTANSTGNTQTAQDTTSEQDFAPGTVADISSDYILDDAHARDLAGLLVQRAKDSHPPMIGTIDNPDLQSITDQLGVDINDRVTLDEPVGSVAIAETQHGGGGLNEIQAITVEATGGTFTLTFGGRTTAPIACNALPAAYQTALQALLSIGAGNALVTFQTSQVKAAILAAIPTLYWRLGEAAGAANAADSSGYNRQGVYGFGTTLGQAGAVSSDAGTSVQLVNSALGQVASNYAAFAVNSKRTFMGYANRTATTDADPLFNGSASEDNQPLLRCDSGTETVSFFPHGQSSPGVSWAAAWPGTGQWVHWALTYDDSTLTAELFINGVSKGTRAVPAGNGYPGGGTFAAGGAASGTGGDGWNGYLQDFAVFESILTPAQIQTVYNAGANPLVAPVQVTFAGALAGAAQALITADPSSLTNGADYFVARLDHALDAGGVQLETQLTVTEVPASRVFLFGVSTFGSTDGFG